MVDQRKAFRLTSSWDHCQRSSPSGISNSLQAEFDPAQNLSSGLSCAVLITTIPRCHKCEYLPDQNSNSNENMLFLRKTDEIIWNPFLRVSPPPFN